MSKERILIVDDEERLVELIEVYLENYGYRTVAARDGEEAYRIWVQEQPDLIVLDILMPNMDGLELCKKIRKKSDTPIIILSAKSEELDRLTGLGEGADDYVTKPFSQRELVARISAVLRRHNSGSEGNLHCAVHGPLEIDRDRHQTEVNGEEVQLTSTEFSILAVLASHPDQVYSRRQLLELSLGDLYEGYERTVDSHISKIRKKIGKNAEDWNFIETVHRVGYKFQAKKKDQP